MDEAQRYRTRLREAATAIGAAAGVEPRLGMILGSGLGAYADTLETVARIPYEEIPGWPVSTVAGHASQLVVGRRQGVAVAVMQGRVHLYEGYAPREVVFPTRVMSLLGVRALLVSNAAGAINRDFVPGELMLIRDHLNLQGSNPCAGTNLAELGPRFFDMTHAYDPAFRRLAHQVAKRQGTRLREGVYAGLLGPSYETPAEIEMLARLGADAVGMSTVPEVIAANHAGIRVVGISCLTNMAAGLLDRPLDHGEVMQTAERARETFSRLIDGLVDAIAAAEGC